MVLVLASVLLSMMVFFDFLLAAALADVVSMFLSIMLFVLFLVPNVLVIIASAHVLALSLLRDPVVFTSMVDLLCELASNLKGSGITSVPNRAPFQAGIWEKVLLVVSSYRVGERSPLSTILVSL